MRRGFITVLTAAVLVVAGCGDDDKKKTGAKPAADLASAVNADSGATAPKEVAPETAPPADPDGDGEVGVAGRGSCGSVSVANLLSDLANVQNATLCLLNAERSARRLRPLSANSKLASAAERHSRDMVRRHFFAHDTPGGGGFDKRIVRVGYLRGARGWSIGENIAWGTGTSATPAQIVNQWMNSPPHRANILSRKFAEIGLGVAVGAPQGGGGLPGLTYTTDFGSRK
jgi:uncharacterized protein YkwD